MLAIVTLRAPWPDPDQSGRMMLPKPLYFTRHALERMNDPDRGIVAEDEVAFVLRDPSVTYVGIDGKLNALGEVGGKRLRVCYVEEQDRFVIITVVNRINPQ